jgi:HPt (histidine-containing phosphotransfer) domain-containing protein
MHDSAPPIDLSQVNAIARGHPDRVRSYLTQFLELVPPRMAALQQHRARQDRRQIRQTLHSMRPQLAFFGVPGISAPIDRLELEYASMPWPELEALLDDIMARLEAACAAVVGS